MNGSHVALGTGFSALLAQVLIWASHWPLHPLDTNTALALAGLISMAGSYVAHVWPSSKPPGENK